MFNYRVLTSRTSNTRWRLPRGDRLTSFKTDVLAALPSRARCDNLLICKDRSGDEASPTSPILGHIASRGGAGNHNQYQQPGGLPARQPSQQCIILKSKANPQEITSFLVLAPGVCPHFIRGSVEE